MATFDGTEAERDGVPYLRFTPEAQELFNVWYGDLRNQLYRGNDESVITAHLSKFSSLMPSLALIFHLADGAWADAVGGAVSGGAAALAVRWCALLEAHARRVYQVVTERTQGAARQLAAKIRAGKLLTGFTLREIQRKDCSGLIEHDDVDRALGLLEEYGWLRSYSVATGGRPTTRYSINPALPVQL